MKLRTIVILLVVLAVLGGYFYAQSRPKPPPPEEPKVYVWEIDMDTLDRIQVTLVSENNTQTQSFVKVVEADKFPWYFDDAQHSPVDSKRWGGGIPLLLSGPGAERVIAWDATAEKLAEFGLANPSMKITLTMSDNSTMDIKVGDTTPDGHAYYVQVPDSNDVCLVDFTWYDVLSRLVTEPPYATAATAQSK